MSDVTRILSQINDGDPSAAEQLLPLVYQELRKLAAVRLANEKPGQTLQPTALVHEAYMRLVKPDQNTHWSSRWHFYGAAAEAMRKILIDLARRKQRVKHGRDYERVNLDSAIATTSMSLNDLLAVDEALEQLAVESPRKAELVKLRFFAGMTLPQAAEILGISRATAERYWTYAKCWLYLRLEDSSSS